LEDLKLHTDGKNDFLKSLKEKYDNLKRKILKNDKLSESEKEIELKKIDENYESERVNSKNSLF